MDGDCYRLSAQWLRLLSAKDADHWRLVHGTVQGYRKRINHAWVESAHQVVDLTQPRDTVFDRAEYYTAAHAKVRTRYTQEKALVMLLKHDHWGPWR